MERAQKEKLRRKFEKKEKLRKEKLKISNSRRKWGIHFGMRLDDVLKSSKDGVSCGFIVDTFPKVYGPIPKSLYVDKCNDYLSCEIGCKTSDYAFTVGMRGRQADHKFRDNDYVYVFTRTLREFDLNYKNYSKIKKTNELQNILIFMGMVIIWFWSTFQKIIKIPSNLLINSRDRKLPQKICRIYSYPVPHL